MMRQRERERERGILEETNQFSPPSRALQEPRLGSQSLREGRGLFQDKDKPYSVTLQW